MKKRHALPRQLGAISVAAGAAIFGATSSAEAGLKVYDHRTAPIYTISEYFLFDQTMAVLNVKTGDYQYIVEQGGNGGETDGVNDPARYNQDGFVDNNLIPAGDLTDDTIWFSHRDVDVDVGWGPKPGDVVTVETPTGGAGGQLDAGQGPVYTPSGGTTNDWYWAEQTYDDDNDGGTPDVTANYPYPVDGAAQFQVDGSLDFNDSSPTGYTGVVTHGFGGLGHGSGGSFGVYPNPGTVAFKLEEGDGTHYGWVAFQHNEDRNRVWIHGWAYQTTAGLPAGVTWIADPDTVPGDFDGDDDVDADDIDILCANMGGDVGIYDMDGDLDVDEDDMTYHVENLVELQDGSGRVGTKRGDFNLDGFVNATDLAIMKPNFGLSGQLYSDGNANCDTVINGTDLAVLSGNIGFAAPTGAVPEPATLSVLALGAAGIASRRRRKS